MERAIMIIPSIDLINGNAVQLVGGRELEIDAGDPRPIARKFGLVGEIAVIDLDAALSQGSNRETILELLTLANCRVGGGIRSVEAAIEWLDAGAAKVILGTAATPEILSQLPKERVIAALDADKGEVVIEGWRKGTGRGILERIAEIKDFVGGFLITFVEKEGRLGGTNMEQVAALVEAAAPARVTIAGGVTTAEEIAELHRLGADAQVGMALYSGRLHLAETLISDSLTPTVVVDEQGRALGLAYSNLESLKLAINRGQGIYWSRKRGLWIKGETSGDTQELLAIDLDCDRDTLRFTVRQKGNFCHLKTATCWGDQRGLAMLESTIKQRMDEAPPGSYTRRLLDEEGLLDKKITEEAEEVITAENANHLTEEMADLIYFMMVKLNKSGKSWADVDKVLDQRTRKITRRPGDAK